MASEPHKVSEPPKWYPHALARDGLVHVAWRELGMFMQMACGCEAANWTIYNERPLPPVTCIWCVVGVLPWLRWRPFGP